jgi:CheY-like chemotaxis protein
MKGKRILVVDDDDLVRTTLDEIFRKEGAEVTVASTVPQALKLITSNVYDILLSDLHMPGAGDGLTVISAMHHANPDGVTMLLSAFPEMDAASHAILLQADQILVKPIAVPQLIETIRERLALGHAAARIVDSVASILERTTDEVIAEWYENIQQEATIMAVPLTVEERTAYLPYVIRDLVYRLRFPQPIGSKALVSPAAVKHGQDRRRQGYSPPLMVDESRMLQVALFHTLQKNLDSIDFSIVLIEVMAIADEVDSQLSQAMASYFAESVREESVTLDPSQGGVAVSTSSPNTSPSLLTPTG